MKANLFLQKDFDRLNKVAALKTSAKELATNIDYFNTVVGLAILVAAPLCLFEHGYWSFAALFALGSYLTAVGTPGLLTKIFKYLAPILKWLSISIGVMLLAILALSFLILFWYGLLIGLGVYFILRMIAEPLDQHFKNQERIIEALEDRD